MIFKPPPQGLELTCLFQEEPQLPKGKELLQSLSYCFQRSFQNKHGSVSALPFHSTETPQRLHGCGHGVLQPRHSFEQGHGHEEALGHEHITTRACSKVGSSEPAAKCLFPFGLRRCSKQRIFDKRNAVFRNPTSNDRCVSQGAEDRTRQKTPHISMASGCEL